MFALASLHSPFRVSVAELERVAIHLWVMLNCGDYIYCIFIINKHIIYVLIYNCYSFVNILSKIWSVLWEGDVTLGETKFTVAAIGFCADIIRDSLVVRIPALGVTPFCKL
jgi:hypothetical protein